MVLKYWLGGGRDSASSFCDIAKPGDGRRVLVEISYAFHITSYDFISDPRLPKCLFSTTREAMADGTFLDDDDNNRLYLGRFLDDDVILKCSYLPLSLPLHITDRLMTRRQ
jgi:hypothetical protein